MCQATCASALPLHTQTPAFCTSIVLSAFSDLHLQVLFAAVGKELTARGHTVRWVTGRVSKSAHAAQILPLRAASSLLLMVHA